MRKKSMDPIQISESELTRMTNDLDQAHNDVAYPAMVQSATEWNELNHEAGSVNAEFISGRSSRRTFLLGSGAVVVGGVALAACGSSSKSGSTTTAPPGSGGSKLTGDLLIGALAASVENLAVSTYMSGLQAAQAGKLGTVPPAVGTFATTAMQQHKDHAAAWNSVLTGAGKSAVTGPDPVLAPKITAAFGKVTDIPGLAMLALNLEMVAAETYLGGLNALTSAGAIKTAASIQPVEAQHVAILYYALGKYPVPDTFTKTDLARPTSDYQA
ncbi:MAG: ferritin-like domain-containing protein [Acidimicrobiales bacterium]